VDTLLCRVEEEQQKNLNLNHINNTLREQLDQATLANQKLSQEIQKVNHEWIRLREQLENREREWREEENVKEIKMMIFLGHDRIFKSFLFILKSFNDFFSQEHGKLLGLWRTVVSFRRSFGEMKSSTERDLNRLRTDLTQSTRTMQTACLNLNANIKSNESQGQVRFLNF
jgi:rootletin